MRTFQEIYDWWKSNQVAQLYLEANADKRLFPQTEEERRKYDLAHKYFNVKSQGYIPYSHEVTRCGTFWYGALCKALHEFCGTSHLDMRFHINWFSLEIEEKNWDRVQLYVHTSVHGNGVRICIEGMPLAKNYEVLTFYARSHREYTKEGVAEEVRRYLRKEWLLAPGHFRFLQQKFCIQRKDFVKWYKDVKKLTREADEREHQQMLESYMCPFDDTWCEGAIVGSGMAADFRMEQTEIDDAAELLREMAEKQWYREEWKRVAGRQAV